MTFGPDGALYVSNFGFGAPPGAGQIVRIEVAHQSKKLILHKETTQQAPPATTVQQSAPRRASVILGQPILQSGEKNSTANDDETMQQVAAKKVSDDSELASVSVTINEARAVLTGTVNSSAAKAKAEKFVRAVRGVRSIANKIVVSVQ
jgi:osmotically-inducible protein OsmY